MPLCPLLSNVGRYRMSFWLGRDNDSSIITRGQLWFWQVISQKRPSSAFSPEIRSGGWWGRMAGQRERKRERERSREGEKRWGERGKTCFTGESLASSYLPPAAAAPGFQMRWARAAMSRDPSINDIQAHLTEYRPRRTTRRDFIITHISMRKRIQITCNCFQKHFSS